MIMYNKIYTCLKQTYANLGLSERILKGQAASLEASGLVTDENLDTVVSAQKQFLEALQSGIDKRVADALLKTKVSRQRKPESKSAVDRRELEELIERIVGEKITSLQKLFHNQTKGERESVPAYSVRPLAKEHGTSVWTQNERYSVTHPRHERMAGKYMFDNRSTNANSDGLSDKPMRQASSHVANDGYHVLHITEKMIHSELRNCFDFLQQYYK